jgi:hypothetical protein
VAARRRAAMGPNGRVIGGIGRSSLIMFEGVEGVNAGHSACFHNPLQQDRFTSG